MIIKLTKQTDTHQANDGVTRTYWIISKTLGSRSLDELVSPIKQLFCIVFQKHVLAIT